MEFAKRIVIGAAAVPVAVLSFADLRAPASASHPYLLFAAPDLAAVKTRAYSPAALPLTKRLLARAEWQLHAPPLIPSLTKRGEPDPAGEQKGLACARALQGRVVTYAMAFTLTGEQKYRDAAVAELRHAIDDWRIWVDTAHPPPYDLMNGEICLTFGIAYDWLYDDLTSDERAELRRGVERRGLQAYLDATGGAKPAMFVAAHHNWNPVCNGGAAVLALALGGESALSEPALKIAVPAMDRYWDHLGDDGGWDEGTGYWTYGHRYAFMAADALRRSGRPGGAERFVSRGARATGYFPIVFNPGRMLTAGFGDSNSRVNDPILYFLGREYENPDFIWFQDRATPRPPDRDGWPEEALALLWRPFDEPWLPEKHPGFVPSIPPTYVFPSIGWAFMAPRQPDPPFFLSLKNGSLAANHTHLDLNHVNIGTAETMLAVELGSRPYPADYFGPRRYTYYELSTAGHNTVLVGGRGQVQGRSGSLVGPTSGERFDALVGIADNVYERPTPRARRHVVFVDKRYWVLLDEIETAQPERIDIRFHTYGTAQPAGDTRWTFAQAGSVLDIASPAGQGLSATIETPDGWTRPVRVLNFHSEPAAMHAVVTVLEPHAASVPGLGPVRLERSERELVISVGEDRVRFQKGSEGWRIVSVR
jgi:Heparinase II/III-like protein/Domain of unknown function (DUF4962)